MSVGKMRGGGAAMKLMRSCMLLLPLLLALTVGGGAMKMPTKPTFTLYMFEQLATEAGVEFTNIIAAAPSGNFSFFEYGNFGLSELVMRESESNTSKIIGRVPGWFSPNKEVGTFSLEKLITLTTDTYNGTLVVFSDYSTDSATNEFAIVGGTGSFRLARGWIKATVIQSTMLSVVYKYEVFLVPGMKHY